MVKMTDLFGFVNDLENFIYGLGFELLFERNNSDRALFRVNANPGAVANDGNIVIRDISWGVPSIDPVMIIELLYRKKNKKII